ncbi:MAG: hypothetical protein PHQ98_01150 [Candidatus ainarchaeum sp.]|nr:hypothetical protein [Candidatus ainarchaeum sp.]
MPKKDIFTKLTLICLQFSMYSFFAMFFFLLVGQYLFLFISYYSNTNMPYGIIPILFFIGVFGGFFLGTYIQIFSKLNIKGIEISSPIALIIGTIIFLAMVILIINYLIAENILQIYLENPITTFYILAYIFIPFFIFEILENYLVKKIVKKPQFNQEKI